MAEPEQMAAHIEALSAEYEISISHTEKIARCFPRLMLVYIPPTTDLLSYYVALHEIGHAIGRGRSAAKLECEANAWVYALQTAKWPPTDEVRELISSALQSYGGGDRSYGGGGIHRNKAGQLCFDRRRIPPDGHPYWSLLKNGTIEVAS